MKKYLWIFLLTAQAVAQTINYRPPMYTLATSGTGAPPYTPYTAASGLGLVNYTPPFFVPMCSATGAPPYSQCTFGGGGPTFSYPTGTGIVTVAGGAAWGTTLAAPTGALVGTTDSQVLTNKTVDTATPTEIAFVHGVTSAIQTQLDSKQAAITFPITATQGGTGLDTHTSTGVPQLSSGTWSVSTTLPSGLAATNMALTTPSIGAATGTSLLLSGIGDGLAPVTVTTGSSATLGSTYKSGYTFNQNATAGTAVAYTLPTAAAGLQYCVGNSYNGSAANTGVLTVNASASGQFIIFTDGTLSATGGNVTSAGAAADFACFVGVDSTHWYFKPSSGTWTKH